MFTANLDPLPPRFQKEDGHLSAEVENTVQAALDNEDNIEGVLDAFRTRLCDAPLPSNEEKRLDVEFSRERRWGQALTAIVYAHSLKEGLPPMIEYHQKHDSLFIPDDWTWGWNVPGIKAPDDWLPQPNESPLIRSGRYWLATAVERVMQGYAHNYHPILPHLEATRIHATDLGREWKKTPIGQRNLMHIGSEVNGIYAFPNNILLAANTLAAFAVYSALYRGITEPAQLPDLCAGVRTEAIPRLTWYSSTVRDLAQRTPENMKIIAEAKGDYAKINMDRLKLVVPKNAFQLIAPASIAAKGLQSTIRLFAERPMAGNPDFCPHNSLLAGPWARAGKCSGNVAFSYKNPQDQELAKTFFGRMGLPQQWGERFNPVMITLAMAGDMHRAKTFPEWLAQTAGQAKLFQLERERLERED